MRQHMRMTALIAAAFALLCVPLCAWAASEGDGSSSSSSVQPRVVEETGFETELYVQGNERSESESSSSSESESSSSSESNHAGESKVDSGASSDGNTSRGSMLAKTGWWLLDHWWFLLVTGAVLVAIGITRACKARR